MKKIVHKPAAPLYAAAAAWVLYALLFPLYRPGHFVIALAASAVVYGIARLFCNDIVDMSDQIEIHGSSSFCVLPDGQVRSFALLLSALAFALTALASSLRRCACSCTRVKARPLV